MAEILDWHYNHFTGAVVNIPSPQGAVLRAMNIGWHGPFKTKEDTLRFYGDSKAEHPDWKEPTGWIGNIQNAITTGADAVTGGIISDPLGKLNLGGWFIRIGEIVLGIVLIGVGVARLTGVTNVISKVAKVAIPK